MPDLLVRKIDEETYARMKRDAQASGKSLAAIARTILRERFQESIGDVWAAMDDLRARIGKVEGNSTDDIREDRDNSEPYR